MDIYAPVSSIMTHNPITVPSSTSLYEVNELFHQKGFHHMPVADDGKLVGMISKKDLLLYKRKQTEEIDKVIQDQRLKAYKVADAMVTGVARLSPSDHIATSLLIFKENRFHCVPVLDEDEIVGILTTHDIVKSLLPESMR